MFYYYLTFSLKQLSKYLLTKTFNFFEVDIVYSKECFILLKAFEFCFILKFVISLFVFIRFYLFCLSQTGLKKDLTFIRMIFEIKNMLSSSSCISCCTSYCLSRSASAILLKMNLKNENASPNLQFIRIVNLNICLRFVPLITNIPCFRYLCYYSAYQFILS